MAVNLACVAVAFCAPHARWTQYRCAGITLLRVIMASMPSYRSAEVGGRLGCVLRGWMQQVKLLWVAGWVAGWLESDKVMMFVLIAATLEVLQWYHRYRRGKEP